jgi:hypothetical protein
LLLATALAAAVMSPATRARAADAAPPPAPTEDPAEAALRRVLSSGCRHGLAEVSAQAGNPAVPWAATVARLCAQILAAPAAPAAPPAAAAPNDGRGLLVVGSTLYGIWLGIAADVLADINGVRSAIVAPLLGMAGGLGVSLLVTADHPVTSSQSWTIVTGFEYGSFNGALWAGGFDLHAKGVVGTALGTGLAGGGVGLYIATTRRPRSGDIEVVRSGLLWGSVAGLLTVEAFFPDAGAEVAWRAGAAAMDVGLVAGLGLAASFDLSRNRVLIIDAGTLGGGLTGFGLAWLIAGGPSSHGRALAGASLAGMFTGMAVAAYLTRHMDLGGDVAAATVPALLARDARGRWTAGTPAPVPLLDRAGQRISGAALTLVGGAM